MTAPNGSVPIHYVNSVRVALDAERRGRPAPEGLEGRIEAGYRQGFTPVETALLILAGTASNRPPSPPS